MSAVVLRGDAAHLPLADGSVDLIVTSPPYFGQRDYRDGGRSLAGQIGSEETPAEYIAALLRCTREWMRVLKPSGSIIVNLGDKYSQRVAMRPSSHQDGLFPGRPELRKDWKRDRAAGLARMPYENVISDDGSGCPARSFRRERQCAHSRPQRWRTRDRNRDRGALLRDRGAAAVATFSPASRSRADSFAW